MLKVNGGDRNDRYHLIKGFTEHYADYCPACSRWSRSVHLPLPSVGFDLLRRSHKSRSVRASVPRPAFDAPVPDYLIPRGPASRKNLGTHHRSRRRSPAGLMRVDAPEVCFAARNRLNEGPTSRALRSIVILVPAVGQLCGVLLPLVQTFIRGATIAHAR